MNQWLSASESSLRRHVPTYHTQRVPLGHREIFKTVKLTKTELHLKIGVVPRSKWTPCRHKNQWLCCVLYRMLQQTVFDMRY